MLSVCEVSREWAGSGIGGATAPADILGSVTGGISWLWSVTTGVLDVGPGCGPSCGAVAGVVGPVPTFETELAAFEAVGVALVLFAGTSVAVGAG